MSIEKVALNSEKSLEKVALSAKNSLEKVALNAKNSLEKVESGKYKKVLKVYIMDNMSLFVSTLKVVLYFLTTISEHQPRNFTNCSVSLIT